MREIGILFRCRVFTFVLIFGLGGFLLSAEEEVDPPFSIAENSQSGALVVQ